MIGKVERVDLPEPGLLCLTLRGPNANGALVLSTLPGALGVGLVDRRPRGKHATEAISQLRRHLVGAAVERVEKSNRYVRVGITRSDRQRSLICTARRPHGGWWLAEDDGSVLLRSGGAQPTTLDEDNFFKEQDAESLRGAGADVMLAHHDSRIQQLSRALDKHVKRLSKKREAIVRDLERATQANALHEQASLVLANLPKIAANSGFFEATTWGDSTRTVRIELDPRMTPSENAQALFQKSKRMKRGLDVAPRRLESVDAELSALDEVARSLGDLSLEALTRTLDELGVVTASPIERARKQQRTGARLPYREFVTRDGSSVLVGRNAADNDRLTLRVAKPHDLWLHARGVTGAHVVVHLAKGKSCGPETLVDAATLAAHFSDLRGEAIVDVLHTPRRFVHKRKGSAIGSVTLGREKVIAVRVEPQRVARLLGSEKRH